MDSSQFIDAYYIDPENGDDNNFGTSNNPLKTIQKGIDMAQESDNDNNKVYLKGGTYSLTKSLTINNQSGEENLPLTIQSAPQELAIISGEQLADPVQGSLISIRDSDHVDILDLEIRNAAGVHGIEIINGNDIDISSNRIYETDGMGIRVRGYSGNDEYEQDTNIKSSNVLIEGNEVTRTNLSNSGDTVRNWGAGIQAWNTHDVSIINNTVGQNYGEGIGMSVVDNATVANNEVYDNFSMQIYLDNTINSTIEENFINNTGDSEYYRDDLPAKGIGFANEIYEIDNVERYYLDNNLIQRNVIANANEGFYYGTYAGIHNSDRLNKQGFKNTTITHNTVYNPQSRTIQFDEDSQIEGVDISNNIFSDPKFEYDASLIDNLTGVDFSRNLWFGNDPGDGYSSTDIFANPSFANAGGNELADYRLRSISEAIDMAESNGDNISSQIADREADLGAIEYGDPVFPAEDFV